MSNSTVFAFAVISGLADIVAILTWLKIEPQHIFSSNWWRMRQVTITGGKLFLILTLAIASVALSSYGFYLTYNGTTLTIQQQPPVGLAAWGLMQAKGAPVATGVFATVATSQFAPKCQDKYAVLIIVRIQDNTVDADFDETIDKSNPFQIAPEMINVPFSSKSLARIGNGPALVNVLLTIVPKDTQLSEITSLNAVSTHGGFMLGGGQVGYPGPGH